MSENLYEFTKHDIDLLADIEVMYTIDCYNLYNGIGGCYVHYLGTWHETKEEMEKALEEYKKEYDKVVVRECKISEVYEQ